MQFDYYTTTVILSRSRSGVRRIFPARPAPPGTSA
jgi:hypothetical protein